MSGGSTTDAGRTGWPHEDRDVVEERVRHATTRAKARVGWSNGRAPSYEAGLDSLFIGDHHSVPVPYYQNVPMLGRLLAEWHERTAGALLLLPLWNPVLAAEQLGTLAAIHDGPFVLQCALGGGESQFAAMGTISGIVRRVSKPVSTSSAVCSQARPSTPTARSASAAHRSHRYRPSRSTCGSVARHRRRSTARPGSATAFLVGPEATPNEVRELITMYRERCDAHGRTPDTIAVRRDIHVGASNEDAERVAGPVVAGGYRGFSPDAPVWGSVDTVTEAFAALGEMGATDVIVRHLVDDQREVLDSIGRLAEVRRRLVG